MTPSTAISRTRVSVVPGVDILLVLSMQIPPRDDSSKLAWRDYSYVAKVSPVVPTAHRPLPAATCPDTLPLTMPLNGLSIGLAERDPRLSPWDPQRHISPALPIGKEHS